MSCCSTDSNSRLALKHLFIENRIIVTLRKDSIKGNLWHVVTEKTREGNLFGVTAPNRQPDLPPSLTGLLQGHLSSSLSLLPSFMPPCLPLASSDTFRPLLFPIHLSYHPLTLSSPPSPTISTPPALSFSHSDTLSLFSACFLSPPESWYEVRGRQRDRSNDPGWITPAEMHRRNRKTSVYTLNYDVLGVVGSLWAFVM